MDDNQQRISIAIAVGDIEVTTTQIDSTAKWVEGLPDYLNDLNAISRAEQLITEEGYVPWLVNLAEVVYGDGWQVIPTTKLCAICMQASARQRAEAFLRTIGAWRV